MDHLIEVNAKPAELNVNYDALAIAVKEQTEKYAIVVTESTVSDAKSLIQELNKTKRALDQKRKDAIEAATAPVRSFDDNMKSLIKLYVDSAANLRVQIQRFEDEAKENILVRLQAYQKKLWDGLNIGTDYRRSTVNDLALLGAITPKGALKAATRQTVEMRVEQDKTFQADITARLDSLASRSAQAGLRAPITRSLVEHFLFKDLAVYEQALQALIEGELRRQQQAFESIKAEVETACVLPPVQAPEPAVSSNQSAAPQVTDSIPSIPAAHPDNNVPSIPALASEPPAAIPAASVPTFPEENTSTQQVTVDCTFEFNASGDLSDEAIEQHLLNALKKIGVSSASSIKVRRNSAAA